MLLTRDALKQTLGHAVHPARLFSVEGDVVQGRIRVRRGTLVFRGPPVDAGRVRVRIEDADGTLEFVSSTRPRGGDVQLTWPRAARRLRPFQSKPVVPLARPTVRLALPNGLLEAVAVSRQGDLLVLEAPGEVLVPAALISAVRVDAEGRTGLVLQCQGVEFDGPITRLRMRMVGVTPARVAA